MSDTELIVQLLTKLCTGETPFFEDLALQVDKIRFTTNRISAGSIVRDIHLSTVSFSKEQEKTSLPISITNDVCEFSIHTTDSSLVDAGNLLYTRRYGGIAIVAGKDEKYLGKLSETDIPIFDRYIHNRIKDYKMHVLRKDANFIRLRLVPTEFHVGDA